MRAFSVITLLAILFLPAGASAEVQTFIATHTYILGDHDSKDDARQRCLLEAKRKVLEQAGVYMESASEAKDFQLTKDKITSFAAAVMQVKDTKEKFGFENGHMTLTLTIKADVDLAEVQKQLAARQVDASVRDKVEAQQERLKRLEVQLEAVQKQPRIGQSPGQVPAQAPVRQPRKYSAADLQRLHTQAAQGDAVSQAIVGFLYDDGSDVPQDYAKARQWFEKAASQGNRLAQSELGHLYAEGLGGLQDYAMARQWFEKAAAQGYEVAQIELGDLYAKGRGVPQDYVRAYMWYNIAAANSTGNSQKSAAEDRDGVARRMTSAQLAEAQRLAQRCQARQFKGC